jgi:hypothetical protein
MKIIFSLTVKAYLIFGKRFTVLKTVNHFLATIAGILVKVARILLASDRITLLKIFCNEKQFTLKQIEHK